MAFLGTTKIGDKFGLITNQVFSDNIPKFVWVCAGSIGTYVYLYRVRKQDELEKINFIFLLIFSLASTVGAVILLLWVDGIKEELNVIYSEILFPSEIDDVTRNVKINLLNTVSYLFVLNLVIGIVCFIVGFYHLKTLNKD